MPIWNNKRKDRITRRKEIKELHIEDPVTLQDQLRFPEYMRHLKNKWECFQRQSEYAYGTTE